MRILLASAIVVGATISCQAQTAEETVAYILWGIESDAKVAFLGEPQPGAKYELKSTSPFRIIAPINQAKGENSSFEYSVVKKNDCNYIATFTMNVPFDKEFNTAIFRSEVDFSSVSGGKTSKIQSSAFSAVVNAAIIDGLKQNCSATDLPHAKKDIIPIECSGFHPTIATQERLNRAISYLRSSFCKGKAF